MFYAYYDVNLLTLYRLAFTDDIRLCNTSFSEIGVLSRSAIPSMYSLHQVLSAHVQPQNYMFVIHRNPCIRDT